MNRDMMRASASGPIAVRPERRGVREQSRRRRREEAELAASEADKARMVERHKLVVNIIDINSQQLRCESAIAGIDIERACAVRDAQSPDASPESRAVLAKLERKMAALSDESQRLATQREFLNSSLSEFDAKSAGDDVDGYAEPVGRA